MEKMADLLAAKASQQEILEGVEASRDEMSTVLETTHEGIFSTNVTILRFLSNRMDFCCSVKAIRPITPIDVYKRQR